MNIADIKMIDDDATTIETEEGEESASSIGFHYSDAIWVPPGPHVASKVRFSQDVRVRRTMGLWQYTPDEIDRCWLTQDEEADFQDEIVRTVRTMRNPPATWKARPGAKEEDLGRYLEEELGLCTRGIEHMNSKAVRLQKDMRRKFVCQVVLEEQEHQRRMKMHDSDDLAEGAIILSQKSKVKALETAKGDAQYADMRRASLPAQYAKTIKHMFFATGESSRSLSTHCDEDEEDDALARRRSSSISYEKHTGVVLEEICKIVENEMLDDDKLPVSPNASSTSINGGDESSIPILCRMRNEKIEAQHQALNISLGDMDGEFNPIEEGEEYEEGAADAGGTEGECKVDMTKISKTNQSYVTKEDITGITDSLKKTRIPRSSVRRHIPTRTSQESSSSRKQSSFEERGNKVDRWGDVQV